MSDWSIPTTSYPYPPQNVQVMSSYVQGCFDLRWDDPAVYNAGVSLTYALQSAKGVVNLEGVPQRATTATATIRVLSAPLPIGTTLTIGGFDLISSHAPRTPGADDFDSSLATPELIAQEIVSALTDPLNSFTLFILAVATDDLITLVAVDAGSAGEVITISTEDTEYLAASVTHLNGGLDADTLTINGVTLTPITGTRTPGANDFSIDGGTIRAIVIEMASALNDPLNSFTGLVTAIPSDNKVFLTAVTAGTAGNAITLAADSHVMWVSSDTLLGGTDCESLSNEDWVVVGVNLYRSDTGERGPYFRINHLPIGGLFYRDCTTNVLVSNEVIKWDEHWISKGDAANDRLWRFRTCYRPVVKREGQAIPAESPYDVTVTIDGQVVPVSGVFGTTGEIDLINLPVYDSSTEQDIPPVLPNPDGSSTVTITYYRQGNLVRTELDNISKIHYRLTTVALTPGGYVETPLGYSPPVLPLNSERVDYIWKEAIRRNRWILDQGGERVKVFIRRVTGVPCRCSWQEGDPRLFSVTKQPVGDCVYCYGTGFLTGYEGPIDITIGPDESERAVRQTPMGRRLESSYEVWTSPSPMLSQRDFIVKQNGERYSIGPVRRTQVRGVTLQQAFNIQYIDECDIRYSVPLGNLYQLPWPETRYTRPQDAPCVPSDPYPVGFDYQATPMGTEVPKIPDGREQRGRTPVWSNLTYGGRGGYRK